MISTNDIKSAMLELNDEELIEFASTVIQSGNHSSLEDLIFIHMDYFDDSFSNLTPTRIILSIDFNNFDPYDDYFYFNNQTGFCNSISTELAVDKIKHSIDYIVDIVEQNIDSYKDQLGLNEYFGHK